MDATSLDHVKQMAQDSRDLGPWYIASLSWLVSVVLFGWLMRVNKLRVSDRDRFQDKLESLAKEMHATVAESGKAFWTVQRELTEIRREAEERMRADDHHHVRRGP